MTPDEDFRFETAKFGILEEICMEGYLDDGRPEDEIAFLLDDMGVDQLTSRQQELYRSRLLPLIRIWYFERERFAAEYARLRALWAKEDGASDVQSLQPH